MLLQDRHRNQTVAAVDAINALCLPYTSFPSPFILSNAVTHEPLLHPSSILHR
jgi:hypothetical protein